MCRELNMEDSVHDLMVQLGADRHGRISFEEFLRCQQKLRGEIRSVTECPQPPGHHRGSISADELYQDRLQRAGSPKMGSNSSLPRSGHLGSWPASSDNSLGEICCREPLICRASEEVNLAFNTQLMSFCLSTDYLVY